MGSRPPTRRRGRGRATSGAGARLLSRPRGRGRSAWRRGLGRPGADRAGRGDRRAARPAEPRRAELRARANQPAGVAPAPLCTAPRGVTRQYAPCRVLWIDHVMGLQRLYCIPSGAPATAGAYVSYPFEHLLRLVALESRRNECAIVGEDLGTVPEGFRDTMRAANALSYRVAVFERRGDARFV